MASQDDTLQGVNLQQQIPPVMPLSVPSGMGVKESEPQPAVPAPAEEAQEYVVPKEVDTYIQQPAEKLEVPPDLQQLGVTPSPPNVSDVTSPQTQAPLPLSDDQIGTGLLASISTSLRWLSEWCLKQLKIVHVHLKKVGAHFIREKDS